MIRTRRYDYANGVSNVPGRPINFVIQNTTNGLFRNLRFVQSQFWTLVVNNTRNTLLENVYINSTSHDHVRYPVVHMTVWR